MRASIPAIFLTPLALVGVMCAGGCRTLDEQTSPNAIDPTTFAMADRNDDGKLSPEELARYRHREALAEFDLNGDNLISSSEWAAAKPSAGEQDEHFNRLDKDGDGHVAESEAVLFVTEHVSFSDIFEKLDRNSDEHLHWEELAQGEPDSFNITLFSLRG